MEESKWNKIFDWCVEHIKVIFILLFLGLVISGILYIRSIQNPKTIEISSPSDISTTGEEVKTEVVYKVSGGVPLSVDAAGEVWGMLAGINDISAIANDLFSIGAIEMEKHKAKSVEELVIPAKAWCGADFEGLATYEWVETSKNYLSSKKHITTHKVLIIKTMALHIIFKDFGFDILVFNVDEEN